MLGADYYETDAEIALFLAEGKVPTGIGENTRIKYIPASLLEIISFLIFSPDSIYIMQRMYYRQECKNR